MMLIKIRCVSMWFNQGSSGATKLPPSRRRRAEETHPVGPRLEKYSMSIWLGISQPPWPDGLFWRRSSLLWHTLTVEFSSLCRGVQQFPMFCKRGSCSVWAFLEDGLDRYPPQRERERELRIYLFGNICRHIFFPLKSFLVCFPYWYFLFFFAGILQSCPACRAELIEDWVPGIIFKEKICTGNISARFGLLVRSFLAVVAAVIIRCRCCRCQLLLPLKFEGNGFDRASYCRSLRDRTTKGRLGRLPGRWPCAQYVKTLSRESRHVSMICGQTSGYALLNQVLTFLVQNV